MKYFVFVLLLCSLIACGGGSKSTNAAASGGAMSGNSMSGGEMQSAGSAAIPNCGAVKAVWVNTKTNVYHEPTDPMYGKTKHGKYMCPSAAKAEGDRPAGGKHQAAP
ncbi:MAG TPA: hypothetical protein VFE36_02515 [Candidatus Baltobacteraceae bacterium]|nr:hypothetical protein [Candidatus Baltobacteraceae bacterium]